MAVKRPFLLLLLLVSVALAGNHNRHHRNRRDNDLHNWLTDEQKEALKDLKQGTQEFKEKVGEFYNQLSSEKRAEWDKFYKTHCFEWSAKVQTADEETEFQKNIAENNLEKVKERMGELKEKLDGEAKKNVEMWEEDCLKLLKTKRMRREIEPAFQDFVKWMTPEQLEDITSLKEAGKDSEVQEKVKEYFGQLPADQQKTLKEEFKGKCKVYFTPLMTPEELDKIKTLKGDKEAAGALVKGVVERQTGDVKAVAQKMLSVCGEVYKDSSRKRREIEPAFQDFVKWMTPEQLGDITSLKAAGKDSEVQEKVKEYFGQLPADQQKSLKEEFKGKCKVYFTPLMTSGELKKIETMKGDKEAAGALMKEVIGRQTGEVKTVAEKMLSVCGEVYKDSSRKRREIEAAFQDFVKWMTPEQLSDITAMKAAGKDGAELQAKTKEYFGQLPSDQQKTLKEEFKGKCKVYFTPLMTSEELEKIKTLKGDKEAAGVLVKGVVDRQIGDVKSVSEKMLAICGEVYKDSSRKRREIEAAFQDFVKWMTPEQLGDITSLKAAGKDSEVQEKVKEYFGQLPADQQKTLTEEFKGKCKVYFTPLMTTDEIEKIKTLKGDKDGAGALMKDVIGRQTGEVKTVAEKMLGVCTEVYKDSSRKRREIEPAFQDFVKWMTPEQLGDITSLKAAGKDSEVQEKVKEYFGQLPVDQQKSLKEEFKGKCKVYFTPLMTSGELEKIETMKGDKEAAGALMKEVIGRQTGEVKTVAEKMLGVCSEVYKESSRKRREIEAAFQDFVKWMTPEQLSDITAMKAAGKDGAELQAKTKEYFGQLPSDQQKTLKEEFKGKCKVYFTPLMTSEELEKIKTLKGDKEAAGVLVKGVVDRQIGDVKSVSEKMLAVCGEVYKDSSRKRREIEPAFQDFVKWMTPEQLGDITSLKAAGKDSEVQEKVKEYFGQLPADQRKTLTEEFKGKCKTYFTPLLTSEETEKIKALVESGDKEGAADAVKAAVDRQTGEVKTIAEKMFGICGEVYKESKSKRDVSEKIEKHLSWLQPEEKAEILQMTKDGKSKDDIKKRLLEFVAAKEKEADEKAKAVKLCYAWMDDVATKDEIESLHKLHHVDHGACKKKVREFIERLSEDKQAAVEASLPFCEKLWYGDHASHEGHAGHGDHSGHSGHHHRRRRHLAVIEKYIEWLDDTQKGAIEELETSGADFGTISDKIKEFFYLLPEEKQTDVKEKFQHQCMIWAKEVSKPLEWEEIKKYHAAQDFTALKTKLVELEERLTENQKHTIEHVRGVCYKLWGIKHVARRRRVPNVEESFQEKAAKYLDWMNEEQLAELQRLKNEGKKSEVMKAILKFYDATTGDAKVKAEEKLKGACREYSVKAFGEEKVAEFKKLSDEKADKAEMEKLAEKYIGEIEDEKKKEFAQSVVTGCKHVYSSSRSRRNIIAMEVAEYLQNAY